MEKLGSQFFQLSQNLIYKYLERISQNTINNALEEFYDGIRKILGKAVKMHKTYRTRPTWWSDAIERLRKVYLQKKKMLYKNVWATVKILTPSSYNLNRNCQISY
jgi:DUF438 domain-containing protein